MKANEAGKIRILIVDDERCVLEAARMSVESPDYLIQTTDSPMEALQILERSGADLVITDYAMPVMKGDELTTRIRKVAPSCPIIMMTAYAEMLDSKVVEQLNALVSKPFFPAQLREAVKKCLAISKRR